MTALVENRAALRPASVLTNTQQNALRCVALYKHQKKIRNGWWIGNFRFSDAVMTALEGHKLVREHRHSFGTHLKLTTAGEIAADRLRKDAE